MQKVNFQFFVLRLVFGKVEVDGVTGPRQETDIGPESDLKVMLKGLGYK